MVELFTVKFGPPGVVSVMARPRGDDWLSDELNDLKRKGVTLLISLLADDEILALGLRNEASMAERLDIEFLNFPIPDRGVPQTSGFADVVEKAEDHLADGGHIAIHCRMGIGRAPLLAAALLQRSGVAADDAWRRIADARGLTVPDTEAQKDWVRRFVIS